LRVGHPFLKLDSQAGQCNFPIPQRHCPFLADVRQNKVEQFQRRIVAGSDPLFLVILRKPIFTDSTALVV
jgi:hypothetical protein